MLPPSGAVMVPLAPASQLVDRFAGEAMVIGPGTTGSVLLNDKPVTVSPVVLSIV